MLLFLYGVLFFSPNCVIILSHLPGGTILHCTYHRSTYLFVYVHQTPKQYIEAKSFFLLRAIMNNIQCAIVLLRSVYVKSNFIYIHMSICMREHYVRTRKKKSITVSRFYYMFINRITEHYRYGRHVRVVTESSHGTSSHGRAVPFSDKIKSKNTL